MRIIFAGTPSIAAVSLKTLLDESKKTPDSIEIVAVYSQPDRPQGRGQHLTPSPVKQLALENNILVETPVSLKSPEALDRLKKYKPDLMIVCAYGLLLPLDILNTPIHGCWNIHVSLLPRWRGAAPIQRAIEAGDTQTGICIMQMDAGLDTGDILLTATCPIFPTDNSALLHDRLAILGSQTLLTALEKFSLGTLTRTPQSSLGITYAKKLEKSEAPIDWTQSAHSILAKIRALNPFPIANTQIQETETTSITLKIYEAHYVEKSGTPGTILEVSSQQLLVACGEGSLALTCLQLPNGKALPWQAFHNGHPNLFRKGPVFKNHSY